MLPPTFGTIHGDPAAVKHRQELHSLHVSGCILNDVAFMQVVMLELCNERKTMLTEMLKPPDMRQVSLETAAALTACVHLSFMFCRVL